jgi:hypothetical protein
LLLILSRSKGFRRVLPEEMQRGARTLEDRERSWRGSPLDMGGEMDPYGIREVVFEFDNGDTDTFRSRLNEEFHSYELQQMGAYIRAVTGAIRMGRKD